MAQLGIVDVHTQLLQAIIEMRTHHQKAQRKWASLQEAIDANKEDLRKLKAGEIAAARPTVMIDTAPGGMASSGNTQGVNKDQELQMHREEAQRKWASFQEAIDENKEELRKLKAGEQKRVRNWITSKRARGPKRAKSPNTARLDALYAEYANVGEGYPPKHVLQEVTAELGLDYTRVCARMYNRRSREKKAKEQANWELSDSVDGGQVAQAAVPIEEATARLADLL